jgi:branched-subunit amino acid aminotransferase/4-amino-4-deoxychorismate lyase
MPSASGGVQTTPLALGIVDSITRRTLLELAAEAGYATEETRATVEDLAAAEEVMVCSAVRRVTALAALEGHPLPSPSPAADRLSAAMDARRRAG